MIWYQGSKAWHALLGDNNEPLIQDEGGSDEQPAHCA